MARLTDDPRVAEAIAKAEKRGATNERKRINQIIADATATAGEIEDVGHKRAVKSTLKDVKTAIREGVE